MTTPTQERTAIESAHRAARCVTIPDSEIAWQCEYRPLEDYLLAPDHPYVRDMAVARDLQPMDSIALLDIRLGLAQVNEEVLRDAKVRIHIRDAFGKSQFLWHASVAAFLFHRAEEGRFVFHASIPLERRVLETLEANGPNSLQLILEKKTGGILDNTIGTLTVTSL